MGMSFKNRGVRMPLWRRVLLLVALTTIGCGLIAFLLSTAATRMIMLDNAQKEYQALNRQIINSMDNSFTTMSNAAIAAMYNNDMQRYLYKSDSGRLSAVELSDMSTLVDLQLRLLYHTFPDVQILIIIPGLKRLYNIYGTGNFWNTEYDYTQDTWYAVAQSSGELRTFVLNNPQSYYVHGKRRHTMVLSIPFNSSGYRDQVSAYVLVDFSPDIFERHIEPSTLDVYGTLILTDDNQIVYSSVPDLAGSFSPERLGQSDSGTQLINVNGQSCVAVYDKDDFTSWRIVTLVRAARIEGQIGLLNAVWILLILIAFLCMFPIMYQGSKRMTTSLRVLSSAMESVRAGELKTRVALEGEDEFAHLGRDLNQMLDQIMSLMRQKEILAALNKQTELAALQQQVNPHFLYNTLGMLIGLASDHEDERIITICESMGTLMRYATGYEKKVTFFQEMQYVNAYLSVVTLRYEGLFEVECACDPALNDALVLKMCLQPLVENVVMHGFVEKRRHGTMIVECTCDESMVYLKVEDDGAGMDELTLRRLRESLQNEEPLEKLDAHIGVRNVWMRLKLTYGALAAMRIESALDQGTSVYVSFPLQRLGQ